MQSIIQFGTDGWRGKLGSDLSITNVARVAQAFADYLNEKLPTSKKIAVAIGYDTRKNSDVFAHLFARVLNANSIEVLVSDRIIPTPVLSLFVKQESFEAGVMITASHNPPEYNGIKFKAGYGGPFSTEETAEVELRIDKHLVQSYEGYEVVDMLTPYKKHLETFINFSLIEESGIKPAIDSMGGAGQTILQDILTSHNIPSETIFGEASETFNGRLAEPIEKNLAPFSDFLKAHPEFSFGVATDGDADRCGVLLDGGKWLSAQDTIVLLTDHVINNKKIGGDIVKTSSVTGKLNVFKKRNRKIRDVQVGFKYITDEMLKGGVACGFEESGGFGFSFHIPERDGIASALLLCEMLAYSNCKTLSEYYAEKKKKFGDIYYDRIDYHFEHPKRLEILPHFAASIPQSIAEFKVLDTLSYNSSRGIVNGLKFILEGEARWLLLRSSETEPMFRVYAEGSSNTEVKSLLKAGMALIQSYNNE